MNKNMTLALQLKKKDFLNDEIKKLWQKFYNKC